MVKRLKLKCTRNLDISTAPKTVESQKSDHSQVLSQNKFNRQVKSRSNPKGEAHSLLRIVFRIEAARERVGIRLGYVKEQCCLF